MKFATSPINHATIKDLRIYTDTARCIGSIAHHKVYAAMDASCGGLDPEHVLLYLPIDTHFHYIGFLTVLDGTYCAEFDRDLLTDGEINLVTQMIKAHFRLGFLKVFPA